MKERVSEKEEGERGAGEGGRDRGREEERGGKTMEGNGREGGIGSTRQAQVSEIHETFEHFRE